MQTEKEKGSKMKSESAKMTSSGVKKTCGGAKQNWRGNMRSSMQGCKRRMLSYARYVCHVRIGVGMKYLSTVISPVFSTITLYQKFLSLRFGFSVFFIAHIALFSSARKTVPINCI